MIQCDIYNVFISLSLSLSLYIYIYIRRPLLVRGHQAAKDMKVITVKVFLLSASVSLLVLVSK